MLLYPVMDDDLVCQPCVFHKQLLAFIACLQSTFVLGFSLLQIIMNYMLYHNFIVFKVFCLLLILAPKAFLWYKDF